MKYELWSMSNEEQVVNKEKIKSFTDLNAWKEGHGVALQIYKITKNFPVDEKYGLVSQMRRAIISTTSNLAEGFSRNSYNEKIHFYGMAQGSLTELQNQIILSRDLQYMSQKDYMEIVDKTIVAHKLINGLIKGARKIIRDS